MGWEGDWCPGQVKTAGSLTASMARASTTAAGAAADPCLAPPSRTAAALCGKGGGGNDGAGDNDDSGVGGGGQHHRGHSSTRLNGGSGSGSIVDSSVNVENSESARLLKHLLVHHATPTHPHRLSATLQVPLSSLHLLSHHATRAHPNRLSAILQAPLSSLPPSVLLHVPLSWYDPPHPL